MIKYFLQFYHCISKLISLFCLRQSNWLKLVYIILAWERASTSWYSLSQWYNSNKYMHVFFFFHTNKLREVKMKWNVNTINTSRMAMLQKPSDTILGNVFWKILRNVTFYSRSKFLLALYLVGNKFPYSLTYVYWICVFIFCICCNFEFLIISKFYVWILVKHWILMDFTNFVNSF